MIPLFSYCASCRSTASLFSTVLRQKRLTSPSICSFWDSSSMSIFDLPVIPLIHSRTFATSVTGS